MRSFQDHFALAAALLSLQNANLPVVVCPGSYFLFSTYYYILAIIDPIVSASKDGLVDQK